MVVGTSICDLVVHQREITLAGITGVAKDGIVPGLFGYEAGQPAVGTCSDGSGTYFPAPVAIVGPMAFLPSNGAVAALSPAQTGLVALDRWNGNAACWPMLTCREW